MLHGDRENIRAAYLVLVWIGFDLVDSFSWSFLLVLCSIFVERVKAVVDLLDLVALHTEAWPADEAAEGRELLNHLRAQVLSRRGAALRKDALKLSVIKVKCPLCGHAQI